MILRPLFDAASSTYSYLLADPDTRDAVLIDAVFEQHLRDAALIRELGLQLKWCLETHVHADHVTGAWLLRKAFGARIALGSMSGAEGADRLLEAGDAIEFGSRALTVRPTPGHTNGCVTYVLDDLSMAFTGDALLIRGAGRTDFQQGDARALFHSIRERILSLPDACLLYPAHDYAGRTVTTVVEEREHNARVGGQADESDFVGYMENLGLPHPKKLDVAVPANLRCGEPPDGAAPEPASWGPVSRSYAGIFEIEPTWVIAHPGALTLLDVRTLDELSDPDLTSVEGALHIPLDQLRERLEEVPTESPVGVLCRSGRRSAQASVILRSGGVEAVNIRGGMLRWRGIVPDGSSQGA
ncbi:MAG: MBL fold metallo-hydrolase [Sandaracinaceae bacterium]